MYDDPKNLDREQLEWVSEIVFIYRDDRDWTNPEYAALQAILDKLDAQLDAIE